MSRYLDEVEQRCSEMSISIHDERFITKEELAIIISMSPRTIEKNSHKMRSRVKIGRAVRYNLPMILKDLALGIDIFGGKKR